MNELLKEQATTAATMLKETLLNEINTDIDAITILVIQQFLAHVALEVGGKHAPESFTSEEFGWMVARACRAMANKIQKPGAYGELH